MAMTTPPLTLNQALQQAIQHHQAGQLPEAEHLYRAILRTVPTHADANHNLGILALNVNNPNAALPFLKQALESNPSQVQFWLSYIEGLIQAEQFDLARAVLVKGQAVGLNNEKFTQLKQRLSEPTRVELENLQLCLNQQDTLAAEYLARQLTERYPTQGLLWQVLGNCLQSLGRLEQAVTAKQQAAALLPDNADVLYNLGNGLKELKQFAEAEKCYRQAIALAPADESSYNNLGLVLGEMGQVEPAEKIYRRLIALNPHNADAYNNLGNTLRASKRYDEAQQNYAQAIALNPSHAEAYKNWGDIYKELLNFEAAEKKYQKAIALNPHHADAYANLGDLLKKQGRFSEAEKNYQHAIHIQANHADAYNNWGNLCAELNRLHEAEKHYQQALRITPNHTNAHNNLGNLCKEQGRLREAETHFLQAIAINGNCVEAYNNLGNMFNLQGRWDEAEKQYLQAIAIAPAHADAYSNLANIFNAIGRTTEAETLYHQAIAINPHHADAYNNLANPLRDTGRLEEAEKNYRQAIKINPHHAIAYANLGNVLQELGRFTEAESCYRHALKINPDYAEAYGNLLFSLNYTLDCPQSLRLAEAKKYGALVAKKANTKFTRWLCHPTPTKLRIGLVSGDLYHHPVSYFLESLLLHCDKTQFELIAYPTYRKVDEMTLLLQSYFTAWKPLFDLSDFAAAQMIHNDALHILVDLSGYTGHNRLPVFAFKPAPLQISWLGYWATTGVAEMDYILVDNIGVPEQAKSHFSEKVCYLPDTRLCFTVPPFEIAVSPLPALKNGFITFGCFQNLSKVTEQVLRVWANILTQLPQARLRFQAKQLREESFAIQFYQRLAFVGIDTQQVDLYSISDRATYLNSYAEVDVVLDTFPFPGGTTTCEALWMGVPTLTLAGESLIARQGASLLTAAGLPDWIVDNEEDYISQAVKLAKQTDYLSVLRCNLRAQVLASPLFDGARFAKNFENTLWNLWHEHTLC